MNTARHASRVLPLVLVALLASALAGCAGFRMNTPRDFARLPDQGPTYAMRSVSAYGVALAVRSMPNRERGNLDFWTESVDRQLQHHAGYRSTGTAEVHSRGGLTGRRLEYSYGDPRAASTYWVTLFVTPGTVFVVEAGGAATAFERARGGVEQAITSFAL